jgi:hypothetical protein
LLPDPGMPLTPLQQTLLLDVALAEAGKVPAIKCVILTSDRCSLAIETIAASQRRVIVESLGRHIEIQEQSPLACYLDKVKSEGGTNLSRLPT